MTQTRRPTRTRTYDDRMAATTVTIGVAGHDGATVAWSREDRDDLLGQGRFAGTPAVVDTVVAVLTARTPIVLPSGVRWTFLPAPALRPDDVAAAMYSALQVDADVSGLLAAYPTLGGQPVEGAGIAREHTR